MTTGEADLMETSSLTLNALVIDDSRAIRRILGSMLVDLGWRTHEAENGRHGLDVLAEAERIDVALVDWNMPEMNGLEFIKAVRADPRWGSLPILMVTSETEFQNMADAMEAGANEYAMKPFDRDVIRDKLSILGF
ncbi:MAG: response regulator [Acidimicrobiales bacterium]